ncbi:MAG TPA: hypothetical protein VHX15_07340 [Frankiaceae bacterium]|jgi:hypothetical protein|nr:hypothetical protein [Frankiaceae bacterium]
MAEELANLMRSATDSLVLPSSAAEEVISSYRRKRRRRLATLCVAGAVAVAAAVAVPLATTNSASKGNVNRLVPASPSTTVVPLASVSGIDITYLPEGLVAAPNFVLGAMIKENGHSSISQYYQPASGQTLGGDTPGISLAVQRGYTTDLDGFAEQSKGSTESWTTVRGKRALLQTLQAIAPATTVTYELTWVEAPNVTLTVFSSGKVSQTEVMRVADGLVVHPAVPLPADPAAANAAVRQVVLQAFTGGQSSDVTLRAIENGKELTPVLAKLTESDPELVRTVRVQTIKVYFVSADQAIASTMLTYRQGGFPQTSEADVTVNDTGGHWLVSESSYCGVIAVTTGGCPRP